ncbi:hypothetical protein [Bradyrhizobium sp. BR 1432]|uniref:hypothetical protein n=1 Tax=Bradyrhizobium sp. BR 1432 TaxID=3447966 RepID=UPI003EE79BDF
MSPVMGQSANSITGFAPTLVYQANICCRILMCKLKVALSVWFANSCSDLFCAVVRAARKATEVVRLNSAGPLIDGFRPSIASMQCASLSLNGRVRFEDETNFYYMVKI